MSKQFDYVSLHNHSDYSLLDGLGLISEYVEHTTTIKQRGLGLTDHGNGHGIFEFMRKTKDAGLIGIPGVEFYVAPENPQGAKAREPIFYANRAPHDVSSGGSYLHLTVWAYTEDGLHNLFKLLYLANSSEHFYSKPRIDTEMLFNHSEGLIVASGCPSSEVNTRFLLGQDDKAYEYASRLLDVFGKDRFFVEIMNHHMSPVGNSIEDRLIPKQVELARKMGVRLLATNDSHYARTEDATTHEEFLCLQSAAKMTDKTYDNGGRRFAFSGNEFYLRTTAEMNHIFPDEDFPGAIKNTLLVAEMAQDLELPFNPNLKPSPQIDGDMLAYYETAVLKGLRKRYGSSAYLKKHNPKLLKEIIRRHKEDMETLHSSDFLGYMLVVKDYIDYANENLSVRDDEGNILALATGPGRGSVGGNIHAYALGISEVDPIRHNLLASRFMSPGRGATKRITFEDGTYKDLLVSDILEVEDASGKIVSKYVHEINDNDIVLIDDEDEG